MRRWTGLGQIAMSVLDLETTVSFYERMLGYGRNGGYDRLFNGRITDKVLARRGVRHQLRWLSDRDPSFQLELVHFDEPAARPAPADRRVCDIGYCRISVWVQSFDAAVARLRDAGALVAEPRDFGDGRRACARDPDGVVVELLERDLPPPEGAPPRAHRLPVETRAISLSVPSLDRAEPFFETVLGMPRAAIALHTPAMEEMWGLGGAQLRSSSFWAGRHLIELVEYENPRGRARRPDHHVGDAGIYHVALRFRRGRDVRSTHREVIDAGHGSLSAPANLGLASLVYLRAPDDFLVECLYYHPIVGRFIGYGERSWS